VDGYQTVIEGHDPHNMCTQFQIFELWQHCALLCMAYVNARENMNSVTWQECCCLACKQLNVIGIQQAIDYKIIQSWNISFRGCKEFPHPNPVAALGKIPELPVFNLYPDMKALIWEFCLSNLVNLTIEKVQAFVKSVAIPECIWRDGANMSQHDFLKQCSLKNILQPTIHHWMKLLDFSYCD